MQVGYKNGVAITDQMTIGELAKLYGVPSTDAQVGYLEELVDAVKNDIIKYEIEQYAWHDDGADLWH